MDIPPIRGYDPHMLLVPVGICPRVDLIFRDILSKKERLLDFLNAVLAPQKFTNVEVIDPDLKPDVLDQKTIVLDVRATDRSGRQFQIEMQCWLHPALEERMLFSWARLYQNQLPKGEDYEALQPAIAIWLVDRSLWADDRPHHCFEVRDNESGLRLSKHLQIHTFELDKIRRLKDDDSSPRAGWLHFFAEGESWAQVPDRYRRPAVESAMSVLEKYKNNEEDYEIYRMREDWLRVQSIMERGQRVAEERLAQALEILEQERAAKEQERAAKEQAEAAKEQAVAAKEQERAAKEQERAAKEQALAGKEQAEAKLRELLARLGLTGES